MGVEERIKERLMQEIYASIDRIYDAMEQNFVLDESRRMTAIRALNALKDELFFVVQTTPLS